MRLSTETDRFAGDLQDSAPRVGIVIGPPRSGTTLVGSMLARGTGVLALSEPLLAWSIFGPWRRRKFLRRVAREAGLRPAEPPPRPDEREFLTWLLERARASERKVVVLKETFRAGLPWNRWNNATQLERILQSQSAAAGRPVIAIVRHPCAVAASTIRFCAPLLDFGGWKGVLIRLVWPVLPRLGGPDHVVRVAARNWAAFGQWLVRNEVPRVRYEELVARPREILAQITEVLQIPFESAMLDPQAAGRAVGLGDFEVLRGASRAVHESGLARGGELTAAQWAIVRDECGEAAAALGYSLDR